MALTSIGAEVENSPPLLTIVISLRILAAELCANNLEQIKSVNVASSSPMYSMIFLLIQGFILLSINTYRSSEMEFKISH